LTGIIARSGKILIEGNLAFRLKRAQNKSEK
jgi:hypothetical protein